MAHTRSNSLAKAKAKLQRHPTRTSLRLAASQSSNAMQLHTPVVLVKEAVMSMLPPKKRPGFREEGESSSKKKAKALCRRSRRIATIYSATRQMSEEKVVIEISDDSEQHEETNLSLEEALPNVENGGGVDLPKNDVYDTLWAMLDAESENEAEEIPEEWDLDSILLNWGKNEPDMGPAGPDQGPPPAEI
ncbi:hypothetical protein PIB30_031971 [Stylosanthes scabra]|uniref:Uncharacterized protein n=1 Tax=Stylosanthes scabra TaxID=79078 RepID=A0ABU6TBQ9_9FABA|nr:hypothetical protein [Stylosanthes scabra]